MIFIKQKPNISGAFASSLCLVHCIATPFLFIAQAGATTCCQSVPLWWQFIDVLFLIISFIAINQTINKTSSNYIKLSLCLSWLALFVIIINEKIEWLSLNENFIYFPTLALIMLHLYNRKYCQCNENKCCAHGK